MALYVINQNLNILELFVKQFSSIKTLQNHNLRHSAALKISSENTSKRKFL